MLQLLRFKRGFNDLELTRNLFTLTRPLKINTIPLFLTRVFIQGIVTQSQWPPTGQHTELTKKDQLSSMKFSFPFRYGLMFLCGERFGHCSLDSSARPPMPTSLSRMKSLCRQTVRSPQVKELLFQEGTPKAILFFMEPHFFRRQVASSQNEVCKPSICFKNKVNVITESFIWKITCSLATYPP